MVEESSDAGSLHHAAHGSPPRSGEELGRRRVPVPPRNGEGDQPKAGGGGPRVLQAPIKTVKLARKLRKDLSPAERLLWWALKQRPGGYKFRKQCPQGPFALDFACLEARLAIEVDGEAHGRGDRPERDARRDSFLKKLGFSTMRIPAQEVFGNLEGVVRGIVSECDSRGPLHRASHGSPPRSGEEQG
ncbi:MAG: endonuclease domain-containing protein [Allosphingosinicella sp.]